MGCDVSVNCQQNHQKKYKFSARLLHQSENASNNPENMLNVSNKSDVSDFESRLDRTIASYQQFLEENADLRYPFDGLGNIEDQIGYLQTNIQAWYQESRESGLINGNPFDALSLCYSLKKGINEGRKWYEMMVIKHPANQYLHFGLGNIYYKLEMYDDSQKCYRKTIDLNPRFDKAYQNIANIYCFKRFDNAKAEQWSKFAIKLNPKNQYAQLINAMVHENLNHQIHFLEKLLETHPNYSRIYNALGHAYMEKNKIKTAIKLLLEGYTKNSAYYAIPCSLALAYNKINKFDEAIIWSNKSIELNPFHHEPYHSLADAYQGKGMKAEAKKWYLKCIEINSEYSEAYLKIGKLYLEDNEAEAIKYLETYIERNPESSQGLYELGKLFKKRKEFQISVKYLLNISEIQNYQEPMLLLAELLEALQSYDQSDYYFSMLIKKSENKQEAKEKIQEILKKSRSDDRVAAFLKKLSQQLKI